HFDALAAALVRAGDDEPLSILSAGCASGEEPYSLAIQLREALPPPVAGQASILGVDINARAIEQARAGCYSAWALRETPESIRVRYFRPASAGRWLLDGDVQAGVTLTEGNLIRADDPVWRPDAYDVIFCRNVLIYFAHATICEVVAQLTRALRPG